MKKLGIIGLGHMGMAIAKGAVSLIDPTDMIAFDHDREKRKTAEDIGIATAESVNALCTNARMVLVAVRPQDIPSLLEEMKQSVPQCILTIAAGIPIHKFTDALGQIPVIRIMPNTPLQYGNGASALCRNEHCSDENFAWAMKLFSSLGIAREIDESHMCDIIAVNGSSPAYFYYLIECMLNDAVSRGIDETTARDLLVQTMIGSGLLLQEHAEKPISVFVDEVCSKGGTTIEAINVLKDGKLSDLIQKADSSCIKRAEELGK